MANAFGTQKARNGRTHPFLHYPLVQPGLAGKSASTRKGAFVMKNIKFSVSALALLSAMLCATHVQAQPFTPANTFYAAGSSAQFPTIMVAVGATIFSGGPLCGTHHWSKRNSSGLPIAIHDPRSSSIFDETGNITVIWNDAAAAHTPGGGTVCYFVTTDSVTGVRLYQASGQLSLAAGL